MKDHHPLLARQIRKLLPEHVLKDDAVLQFLDVVDESYRHFDTNRELVERAMRLSSDELREKNELLERESERKGILIESLKHALQSVREGTETVDDNDLLHLSYLLQQAIDDRKKLEDDLRAAQRLAEASLEVRKRFLANVSHEIRTPLHGIRGLVELLHHSEMTIAQRENLDAIRAAAEGLLVIVSDVLDLSKLESGKFSIEHIPFSLDGVLKPLLRSLQPMADDKGITLVCEKSGEFAPVHSGDPTRLQQVLTNLLSNAIKFTAKGKVHLHIAADPRASDTQRIRFTVTDTGTGISEEYLPHIFDPFVQEDASISRRFGGTGLGLSICRNLVELMGGELTAESKRGKGSTFSFVLTFQVQSQHLPESGTFLQPDLKGCRILVAEDNELNRYLLSTLLDRWSARTSFANDGQEALELVSREPFDVILMDLQMPRIDGFEATRMIRASGNFVPIIALTANAQEEERALCLSAGMNEYVPKPYTPEELYTAIGNWACSDQQPANASEHLSKLLSMYQGNQGHVRHTTGIFLRQAVEDMKAIRSALESGDSTSARALLHRLQPSLALFNAHRAAHLLHAEMSSLHRADIAAAQMIHDGLEKAMDELATRLRTSIQSLP